MDVTVPLPHPCLDPALPPSAGGLLRRMARRRILDHGSAVAAMAGSVCRMLDVDPVRSDAIARAALFHDVGKLQIPEDVLDAPGPLTPAGWDVMRSHPERGARILAEIPALAELAPIALRHHERWDGLGYPGGLAGDAIPLGARIVFACDAFDAMTAPRCYRPTLWGAGGLGGVRRGAGSQFDAAVAAAVGAVVSAGPPPPARNPPPPCPPSAASHPPLGRRPRNRR